MSRFAADAQVLKRLPPFCWFSDSQLAWAMPAVEHRTYPARTVIQRAGERGEGLYIVLSGRVCVLHEDAEGHELVAGIVGANDFFGELGLLGDELCAASIRSDGPCEVLHIPRKIVLECLEDNSKAAMCMLKTVVGRLCATHRKMAHLALSSVYERVATVLLENSGDPGSGERLVEVGSEQISARVAASREMVSRVIKNMIEKGMVRRVRRKLIIVDAGALAEQARASRPQPAACEG